MYNFFKKNWIYFSTGFILLIANSLLFILSKPAVAMELFYYPWLIEKGLLIYRDFYHDHGPLLSYLLAPLTLDKSLLTLKMFYILVQDVNLALVLIIIKRFSKFSGFIVGGIVFILLNFIFSYMYFWDEQLIATFFLLIFYVLSIKDFPLKTAVLGVLIGLLALIKPNVVIITIPVFFLYKRKSFLFYTILVWLIATLFFLVQHAVPNIIDNVILYNIFYQNFSRNSYPYLETLKNLQFFLNFLLVISIFAVFNINKKNINVRLLIFMLVSLVTIYPELGYMRFVPFGGFFAIFIAYLFTITNKKLFFLAVLILYMVGFSLQIKSIIKTHQHLISVTEGSRNLKIVSYLKTNNLYEKNFYIMSNNPEIYYMLDRPIQLYFPLMYPNLSSYYKNYQQTYINDLNRNKTYTVIIPQPLSVIYAQATTLIAFVKTNYKLSYKDKDFLVYTKR